MSQAAADRNLLFGIIALQMDFINRDSLVSGMNSWALDKNKTLGQILLGQKALTADSHALLDALVQKHLSLHGDNAEQSLAAISSVGSVREHLEQISDTDVQASLIHLAPSGADATDDPYATVAPTNQAADPFATAAPTRTKANKPSTKTGGPSTASPSVGSVPVGALRFRIMRPHAKGGLGAVFLAKDQELNREVALKEIQDRHADNLESRSRFMLEAEITGGLEHPGIVPVYGLGSYADGRPYYAMRFIRGDSLKEAIEHFHKADAAGMDPGQRTLDLRNLLGRFVDVCNAIAYAHSRNVLHRDLKPGNIMLGKYGETLVVDWGLAKPIGSPDTEKSSEVGEGSLIPSSLSNSSQTLVGAAVGTPQYMSPEQASGKLELLGPASDVYSLGATLYCLLTGHAPINEPDVSAVLQRVQKGDIPKPRSIKENISPPLEAICLKAMALEPKNRYPSPRLLADDIEHWLADEPVSAWPEPWTVKVRRWISRHRTLVTSVVSTVLVAVVGLGVATGLLAAANERERKAKDNAIFQEKEAVKQKNLAEHNFTLAKKAVDTYQTDVSESFLAEEPGTEALKQKLLASAKDFYAQFERERKDDKQVRGEFGRTLYRLAQINGTLGHEAKALDLYQQSVKVFKEMLAQQANEDLKRDLALSYHHLGRIARIADQLDLSEESYKNAEGLWKELLARETKEVDQAGLARTQIGLGNLYQRKRDSDKAQDLYKLALAGWQKLADAHAGVAQYQREVANASGNLGQVWMYQGAKEVSQAKEAFEKSIAIQKKVIADNPKNTDYPDDLGRFTFNLGEWYQRAGKLDLAETNYTQAARLWEKLVEKSKLRTSFSKRLADANNALARVNLTRAALDKKPAAIKAFRQQAEDFAQKAVTIASALFAKHQSAPDYSATLARSYVTLANVHRKTLEMDKADGEYQKALPLQTELVRIKKKDAVYRSDLASTWSSLGQFYSDNKKSQKSSEAFEKAADLWGKLVEDFPKDKEYPRNLAIICNTLGNVALKGMKQDDALRWYARTLQALDSKDIDRKRPVSEKENLMVALFFHADTSEKLKRYPQALEDWTQAIALTKGNEQMRYELQRVVLLARMDKYRDAEADADRLDKVFRSGALDKFPLGEGYYRLSLAYALCAAAAGKDQTLTGDERKRLTEQLTARAVRELTSARAVAFFTPQNVQRLDAATELDAIREQADFKKLRGELK